MPDFARPGPTPAWALGSLLHSSRHDFDDHKGMRRKETKGMTKTVNECDKERGGSDGDVIDGEVEERIRKKE